jgi:hypothetical protein
MAVVTLYGTPQQKYVALGNVVYQADGAGRIANVADNHVGDLVARGCIDEAMWLRLQAAHPAIGLPPGGSVGQVVTNTAPGVGDWETPSGSLTGFTSATDTALGTGAGAADTHTHHNVFVGAGAGGSNTIGEGNTAVGATSMADNVSGSYNTAVGDWALQHSTGTGNVAIGAEALWAPGNTAGGNTAVGTRAGAAVTSGNGNIFIGQATGLTATTGSNNVAVGTNAAVSLTTGSTNISIGNDADGASTGDHNIVIGTSLTVPDGTASHQLNIGNFITAPNMIGAPVLSVGGNQITGSGAPTTAVAGAATLNAPNGVITTEALVAATTYTLTLTDSVIKSTSTVIPVASNATGGVAPPTVRSITEGNGSVVIVFGMAALTGTFQVRFAVFN